MYISNVRIKGFRNFEDSNINLNEKSLVIGSNDIGKSNLIHALRIILDKTISEADLEPKDSDFHVHKKSDEIFILIKFSNVVEDCVLGKLGKYVSDESELFIAYRGVRDESGNKLFGFLIGQSEDDLQEIEYRFYLKVLNMDYIESSRQLHSYIRKEKRKLLQEAKKERAEDVITEDDKNTRKIERSIDILNKRIFNLSYVNNATTNLNEELQKLSLHHVSNNITFDVGGNDVDDLLNNLNMVSKVNDKSLSIGGDGRNNQIFLALRTAKNRVVEEVPLEITISCIEEPEAHLHPQQQRRLSKYLVESLNSQVIITSHSPQIASEFPPDSIVRLFTDGLSTNAASEGCSKVVEKSLVEFGYRLNIIPAEAFFSNVVLLVEGPSEVLFYKALAEDIGIDLDKYNISILMVDGVGFETYIDILSKLEIEWVVRTDHDIFKVANKDYYYLSGILRAVKIYEKYCETDEEMQRLVDESKDKLIGTNDRENLTPEEQGLIEQFTNELECYGIYISNIDLELDLLNSPLRSSLEAFYKKTKDEQILSLMTDSKATSMFKYLSESQGDLSILIDHDIVKPLLRCKELAEGLYHETI